MADQIDIQAFVDKRAVRIVVGAILGIPITAFALVGAIYGILLGTAGVIAGKNVLVWVAMLVVSILGVAGISGGWRRVLKPSNELPLSEVRKIRWLIFSGMASSLSLGTGTAIWLGETAIGAVFFFIAACGALLAVATPVPKK